MRIWGGQIFLGQNAKGINNKTIDKLDFLQIKKKKKKHSSKDSIKRMNVEKPQTGRKYLHKMYLFLCNF